MSLSDSAPTKVLDRASQEIVDNIIYYEVAAEASLRYLRTSGDGDAVKKLWKDFAEEFQKDHDTYPSGQNPKHHEKQLFHSKCKKFYFDAASSPPRPLVE